MALSFDSLKLAYSLAELDYMERQEVIRLAEQLVEVETLIEALIEALVQREENADDEETDWRKRTPANGATYPPPHIKE
jgi:hypothetical protein